MSIILNTEDNTNIFTDIKTHHEYIKLMEKYISLKNERNLLKEKILILDEEVIRLKDVINKNDNYGYWYENIKNENLNKTNICNIQYTINEKSSYHNNILDDEQIKNIYIKYKIPFLYNDEDNENNLDNHSESTDENDEESDERSDGTEESENSSSTNSEKNNQDDTLDISENKDNNDKENQNESNDDDYDEDDDEEVFETVINDKKYYATKGKCSRIYEIKEDESAGKCVGYMLNNKVYFK